MILCIKMQLIEEFCLTCQSQISEPTEQLKIRGNPRQQSSHREGEASSASVLGRISHFTAERRLIGNNA